MKNENQRYLYARIERGDFAYQHNPFSLRSTLHAVRIVFAIPSIGRVERLACILYVSKFYALLTYIFVLSSVLCFLIYNAESIAKKEFGPFAAILCLAIFVLSFQAFVALCTKRTSAVKGKTNAN